MEKARLEKGKEYAILTDEISRAWSGMTTRQYKKLKGLKKENLRDNMSDLELVLTMLAEALRRTFPKYQTRRAFLKIRMLPGMAVRWPVSRGSPLKRKPASQ